MRVSICIAAHGKPAYLLRTLESIYRQPAAWDFDAVETIVVDDRSEDDEIREVCEAFPAQYVRLDGPPDYRNPSRARNEAYKRASGDVIIAQSDDVVHVTEDAVERLTSELTPGHFVIATVYNTDFDGRRVPGNLENPEYAPLVCYTGLKNPRPFFFLGALYRRDLYAVGGNDEEFTAPGREDDWFAQCLVRGCGLKPVWSPTIVGHHLQHKHLGTKEASAPSYALYRRKYADASSGRIAWQAAGGSWPYSEGVPLVHE